MFKNHELCHNKIIIYYNQWKLSQTEYKNRHTRQHLPVSIQRTAHFQYAMNVYYQHKCIKTIEIDSMRLLFYDRCQHWL